MDFMSSMLKDNIKEYYELDESETIGEYRFVYLEVATQRLSRREIKRLAKWWLSKSSRSNPCSPQAENELGRGNIAIEGNLHHEENQSP